MHKWILSVAMLISASAFAAPAAKTAAPTETKEAFKLIHVADLEKSMSAGKVFVYDANTKATREKEGLIPGAKQLASVTSYDAKATLPADKNASLVFYCANQQCMASHEAAKVAVQNGYTNVSVMADGIEGWKKAGKKTEKAN